MTVTDAYQPELLGSERVAIEQDEVPVEERFARFCRRNPWFLKRVAEITYAKEARGATRVSMKGIFDMVRENDDVSPVGPWKLNNDWTALASRRVMELYPDLDGIYETRVRRS